MIALRLFSRDDASRQLDMRVLGEREAVTLGRDAGAGWTLSDPDRALSRQHLTVAVQGGEVSVTDTSTNGVTSPGRSGRFPKDQAVRVDPGERLELGPYVLLIERSEREPTSASAAPEPRGPANPFAPLGRDEEPLESRRRPDPFASGMKPDPLAGGAFGEEQAGGGGAGLLGVGSGRASGEAGLLNDDAWGRRPDEGAGAWNAPRPRKEAIIGEPGAWVEPPAEPADEKGFGFDAPFSRPILRAPALEAGDLAIPSDWDRAPADDPAPEPAPVLRPSSPPDLPAPSHRPARPEPQPAAFSSGEPAGVNGAHPVAVAAAPPPAPVHTAPVQTAPVQAVSPQAAPPPADLLAAFCAGARLDPHAVAGEDPAALMMRLGAIYRQMVLGLSDVLNERTALKNEYRMVRTTIQADENNPFKWAPAQKVAAELLRSGGDGYLDGPDAVAQSYQDVKKHLLCMLAGLRAALSSGLDALAPERIEEAIKDQSFVLKPRAAVAWGEYQRAYAQFRREAEDSADSQINREFRAAYEKQLDELDRMALR